MTSSPDDRREEAELPELRGRSGGTGRGDLSAEHVPAVIRLLRRSPTFLLALVFGTFMSGVSLGMDLLQGEAATRERLLVAVCLIPVFSVMMWATFAIAARIERRRSRTAFNATSSERALRSGRPPVEARADEWLPKLRKLRGTEKREAWAGIAVCLAFSGLGVYLLIGGEERPVYAGLIIALFLGAAVWVPIHYAQRRRNITRLMAVFEERSVGDDARAPSS